MSRADLNVAAVYGETQHCGCPAIDDRHLLDGVEASFAAPTANDNGPPKTGSDRRYVIRPAGNPDRWCVWDTRRAAIVFGGDDLTEIAARALARRLNEAYRRSQQ